MPIPILNADGELPEGIHVTDLKEIDLEFGQSSEKRSQLMAGLNSAADNFKAAGVSSIYIDGSFTTSKEDPNDIDGCWSASGEIDLAKLGPLFWNFNNSEQRRDSQAKVKKKYGLDFFIAEGTESSSGLKFPDFFQTNRDGVKKGILKVNL
ncbi:MAG TPA: hypothetical protein VNJ08_17485 [Bacteriovoracaceae bacterium]|nr:hypothetical protein [Bacteriovoracaceae bacterium]